MVRYWQSGYAKQKKGEVYILDLHKKGDAVTSGEAAARGRKLSKLTFPPSKAAPAEPPQRPAPRHRPPRPPATTSVGDDAAATTPRATDEHQHRPRGTTCDHAPPARQRHRTGRRSCGTRPDHAGSGSATRRRRVPAPGADGPVRLGGRRLPGTRPRRPRAPAAQTWGGRRPASGPGVANASASCRRRARPGPPRRPGRRTPWRGDRPTGDGTRLGHDGPGLVPLGLAERLAEQRAELGAGRPGRPGPAAPAGCRCPRPGPGRPACRARPSVAMTSRMSSRIWKTMPKQRPNVGAARRPRRAGSPPVSAPMRHDVAISAAVLPLMAAK